MSRLRSMLIPIAVLVCIALPIAWSLADATHTPGFEQQIEGYQKTQTEQGIYSIAIQSVGFGGIATMIVMMAKLMQRFGRFMQIVEDDVKHGIATRLLLDDTVGRVSHIEGRLGIDN